MNLKLGLGVLFVGALVGCGGLIAPTGDGADSGDLPVDPGTVDAGGPDVIFPPEPDADVPPPFDGGHDAAVDPPPWEAGIDTGIDVAPTPWDRMGPHAGVVLASPRLVAVYFGQANVNGADSKDEFITWLVGSQYWGTMKQYGVGPGTFVGSVRLDASALHVSGDLGPGMISFEELAADVSNLLHPGANGALDGGLDAEPDAPLSSVIPVGDAYVFFLPDGVNVAVDAGDGTLWHSCVEFGGYHDFDVTGDPYAIMPPCTFGRGGLAISHEITEMVTDPQPSSGWFSDADIDNAGGEIGDLCNNPVTVEGWSVTQLWSNADGDCVPRF